MNHFTTVEQLQGISQETRISKTDIHNLLKVVHVAGDGNCLFNTMSYLLYGSEARNGEIRKTVCDYYKTFQYSKSYPDGSLESKIQMLSYSDDANDIENGGIVPHKTNVCLDKKWGSLSDIYVICLRYNINVLVLQKINMGLYLIQPCKHARGKNTYFVELVGEAHYQPMVPIVKRTNATQHNLLPVVDVRSSSSRKISSRTRKAIEQIPRSSSSRKISSRTRKAIEQIPNKPKSSSSRKISSRTRKAIEQIPRSSSSRKISSRTRKAIEQIPNTKEPSKTRNSPIKPPKPIRQASPPRRQASPPRRQASPPRRQASPVRRQASPVRRQASPVRRQASPVKLETAKQARLAKLLADQSKKQNIVANIQKELSSTKIISDSTRSLYESRIRELTTELARIETEINALIQ